MTFLYQVFGFLLLLIIFIIITLQLTNRYNFKNVYRDINFDLYQTKNQNRNRIIPNHVYQVSNSDKEPYFLQKKNSKMKDQNPEMKFHLFNDVQCKKFIKKNFDQKILNAYESLLSDKYRKDLFSYCILYKKGGIFLDFNFSPLGDFKLCNYLNKQYFVLDAILPSSDLNMNIEFFKNENMLEYIQQQNLFFDKPPLFNGFMICKAGNPILKKCIHRICENIETSFMGVNPHSPTGGYLLGDFYFQDNYKEKIENIAFVLGSDQKHVITKEAPVMNLDDNMVIREWSFENMWKEGKIYKPSLRIGKKSSKEVIPRKVYQTWYSKNLSPTLKKAHETLKKQNPEMTFYLFDDTDCRNFIQKYFDKDVVMAFDSIVPGAFKADLFRYCVLYIHGGVYLDIKYIMTSDSKLVDFLDKEYFVLERPAFYRNCNPNETIQYVNEKHWVKNFLNEKNFMWKQKCGIFNALLITKPKNVYLKECINRIVENTTSTKRFTISLDISGPGLLGKIVFKNDYLWKLHNFELFYNFCGGSIGTKKKHVIQLIDGYKTPKNHYDALFDKSILFQHIPRNIFQTWKINSIPDHFVPFQKSIINLNQNFVYRFFNDNDVNDFMKYKTPNNWFKFFKNLRYRIQQIDFFRYCVLYVYGGFYADIDFECQKGFDDEWYQWKKDVLIAPEEYSWVYSDFLKVYPDFTSITGLSFSQNEVIVFVGNFALLASKESKSLYNFIEFLMKMYHIREKSLYANVDYQKYVFYTTGPYILTEYYHTHKDAFTIIPRYYKNNKFQCGHYGIHHAESSWM